jgi:predicted transcriptional regulator
MTNYFKIYLGSKKGITKKIAKTKEEVMEILEQAKKEGFKNYMVIKRIKSNTDVTIGQGSFSRECKVSFIESLDTDWRIVGANVVDWNKYKKAKEDEER